VSPESQSPEFQPSPAWGLEQVQARSAAGDDAAALRALAELNPGEAERPRTAQLALALGRPRLAAVWAQDADPLTAAAALLRLGHFQEALTALAPEAPTARVTLLRARAEWGLERRDGLERGGLENASTARRLARQEGDGPALMAAATLMGERLQPGDPYAALRALAEGLRTAEVLETSPDPYLLAVLALVQSQVGSPDKARRTALKALECSAPRSPARVLALRLLGREEEARAEAAAGEMPWEESLG